MDWATGSKWKGPWFDSQSAHTPGLPARSYLGVCKRQQILLVSHTGVSLPFSSPPLSLKVNKIFKHKQSEGRNHISKNKNKKIKVIMKYTTRSNLSSPKTKFESYRLWVHSLHGEHAQQQASNCTSTAFPFTLPLYLRVWKFILKSPSRLVTCYGGNHTLLRPSDLEIHRGLRPATKLHSHPIYSDLIHSSDLPSFLLTSV